MYNSTFPNAEDFARFFDTMAAGLRSGDLKLSALTCSSDRSPWNNHLTHTVEFEFVGNVGPMPKFYGSSVEPVVKLGVIAGQPKLIEHDE